LDAQVRGQRHGSGAGFRRILCHDGPDRIDARSPLPARSLSVEAGDALSSALGPNSGRRTAVTKCRTLLSKRLPVVALPIARSNPIGTPRTQDNGSTSATRSDIASVARALPSRTFHP